jgi:hypothetical protein
MKMRLIDEDVLVRESLKILTWLMERQKQGISTTLGELHEKWIDSVRKAPTAYDPDKVVEQLEERTTFLKECTKYGNKDAEQQEKSYATMMMYEVAYLVDDLLEIVKGGGVDGQDG